MQWHWQIFFSRRATPTRAHLNALSRLIDMVLVHRCRFVEWVPSGIEALELTPDGQWLAVARSDASIELWHSEPPTWHLEKVRPHSTAG